jgi:mRNA-degrading endonuclease toxin of MazEF toxin-antitoxin module
VELGDRDAPVHKADLEDRRGMLSPSTMAAIGNALRDVLALH